MNFTRHNLGYQRQGSVAEVTLSGTEANVLLLDSINLANYKASRRFVYRGGHYKRSPVRIRIPRSGTWYIAVDLGGRAGRVRSLVRMLS